MADCLYCGPSARVPYVCVSLWVFYPQLIESMINEILAQITKYLNAVKQT